MDWTWSSPIALGLFLLMVGGALVLVGLAVQLATGAAAIIPRKRR